MLLLAAAVIIAVAVIAIARGIDVRLSLLLAAFAMAGLAGDVTAVVKTFLMTFSNEKFVVPICTAMGFAYVLRLTGCDQHLVQLLVKPLRHGKFFLIPGVVLVGFLVNIPVISQTSTAVCIGAVVVPLMRAANLSPVTVGASLLLGASIGGELLNPGAPELLTVAQAQKPAIDPREVVEHIAPLVFPHLALATLLFWVICVRAERRAASEPLRSPVEAPPPEFRVNIVRALVPFVPLVLLFITGEPLNWYRVPADWVVSPTQASAYPTRLIGAAMLVGVLAAALANPRRIRSVMASFFEGAGYAFAHVVSLIVTANCFGVAVEKIGFAQLLGDLIAQAPALLQPMAGGVPLSFAALSGSGMAATQSLYQFFVAPSVSAGANPVDIGALVSTSAAAGRTMSPVAAVVLMSAQLSGANPFALARRVAGPLLLSLAVMIVLRMMRVL